MENARQAPLAVTTVILAGGRGVRIGGNKGLQKLMGKPLLEWVLQSVTAHSAAILISANEQLETYQEFGYPVVTDILHDWQGPLAGLQAGMQQATTEYVLSVPCDTPFLPHDLVSHLMAGMADRDAAVAVVAGKRQPAITLYRRALLPQLVEYIDSGKRKVNDWLDTLSLREVNFDDENKFNNINTLNEMAAAEEYAAVHQHDVKKV